MDLSRMYHTLRYLKPEQWFYRAWYKVKRKLYAAPKNVTIPISQAMAFGQKAFYQSDVPGCYDPTNNSFSFLNISHSFGGDINWDLDDHGRLWAYNLNYFNWLGDASISVEERLESMRKYTKAKHKTGDEPYPISLRGIQWIKFIAQHGVADQEILATLYRDYDRLSEFPEYQIQANHLLENGFSLFFAGHFFNDKHIYELAHTILDRELKEQILPDGGHYELSPMYHCIVLQRLLECIELSKLSDRFDNGALYLQMEYCAQSMLGWLKDFMFRDGTYAMFGDAAPGIAPEPEQLMKYAAHLQIMPAARKMKESGYRKYTGSNYELVVDAGEIRPRFQPGHAHADTFSYCLNVEGRPVIVDTGISTYEKNGRRLAERGTEAHNTVTVAGINSSDVWDGFRVGKRALVSITEDEKNSLKAAHNGYDHIGIIHERHIVAEDKIIIIADTIEGYKDQQIYLHIHFHPSCNVEQTGPQRFKADNIIINIGGGTGATLVNYLYCSGYNKTEPGIVLRTHIEEHAVVSIEL
jgi:hypothetical protein